MLPTEEQIREEAHARWEEGGREEGFALDDWVGAEQDLMMGLNYDEIALHLLDAPKR